MNLEYLATFIKVIEKKSFSKAAEELNLTQPAVSFQVQALERECKETLLDRSSTKLRLTQAGKVVYRYAQHLTKEERKMLEELADLKGIVKGELMLGASTIPGEYILPSLLSQFKKKYPLAQLHLEIGDSLSIAKQISQHQLDIGFIGSKFPKLNVVTEKFAADELYLTIPSTHPLSHQKKVTIKDTFKYPWVLREPGSGTRKTFLQELEKKGYSIADLNVVMELGSTQAVITAVASGLGISTVSEWALQPHLANQTIKALSIADLKLKRDFFLAYHPKTPLSRIQEAFINFVRKKKGKIKPN